MDDQAIGVEVSRIDIERLRSILNRLEAKWALLEQHASRPVAGGLYRFRTLLTSEIKSLGHITGGNSLLQRTRDGVLSPKLNYDRQRVPMVDSEGSAKPGALLSNLQYASRGSSSADAHYLAQPGALVNPNRDLSAADSERMSAKDTGHAKPIADAAKFYLAFENRFRGTIDEIRERLQIYLPFVAEASECRPDLLALDLGCGRGEFLELMTRYGFPCEGVDMNSEMVALCREAGLIVTEFDALQYLRRLPAESRSCISMIHMSEHLPFEYLRDVVSEAHRVLAESGVLIVETPNPENILMGSCDFYIDPTHVRPIPPSQLQFVIEYAGFNRVKILRLQEDKGAAAKRDFDILDLIVHVSPDYAVVAQRAGSGSNSLGSASHWSKEYGLGRAQLLKAISKQ